MRAKRVCLVSPGHLASNPRLVKEADALHEAGFEVKVVAADITPGVRPLDAAILRRAPWPVVQVRLGRRVVYLTHRLRQEFARSAYYHGLRGIHVAVLTQNPVTQSLAEAATAAPADLYIGHCLAALPAVAAAARRNGSKLGFDAEDDHVGELEDTPENRQEIAIRQQIEANFLPKCRHLTASSSGIARAYAKRYGVTMTPILNVFPLAQAPRAPTSDRRSRTLSVYWFSQTIAPGRGLEPFIKAMGKMHERVTLSVRGSDFLGYSARLKALAAEVGVADAISFLPSAPPDEMAQLAAEHDVGLASELSTPPNRGISLTNKIFTYLLAGIPVLLSDTPAQREFAAELGVAARLVDLRNPDSVVAALDAWALDEEALIAAKRAACTVAQARFNWDKEKEIFLQSVRQTLQ